MWRGGNVELAEFDLARAQENARTNIGKLMDAGVTTGGGASTPGDNAMASLAEVRALLGGQGAAARR